MAGEHTRTSDNETLTGGTGTDTFMFDPDNGSGVVTDFTNGEDLIDWSVITVTWSRERREKARHKARGVPKKCVAIS